MPEKRTLPGWKVVWVAGQNSIEGWVMVSNGAISTDPNAHVVLDRRGWDTDELKTEEKKALSLKEQWEW